MTSMGIHNKPHNENRVECSGKAYTYFPSHKESLSPTRSACPNGRDEVVRSVAEVGKVLVSAEASQSSIRITKPRTVQRRCTFIEREISLNDTTDFGWAQRVMVQGEVRHQGNEQCAHQTGARHSRREGF